MRLGAREWVCVCVHVKDVHIMCLNINKQTHKEGSNKDILLFIVFSIMFLNCLLINLYSPFYVYVRNGTGGRLKLYW